MNQSADIGALTHRLDLFSPDRHPAERALALYAASITFAEDGVMAKAIERGQHYGLRRSSFYEIVLQSYLFLGFPRMLTAVETLHRLLPANNSADGCGPITTQESKQWFNEGSELYKKVYGPNNLRLMDRVSAMAPEVFRWMIIEGYGKVLSRPNVDIISRELAIMAFLMMENREKQLHSHIRGALNVGAPPELVTSVIDDIGPAAGNGYGAAKRIIGQLKT
ncbi:MAG: hypothetical protein AB1483_13630 [Candidatus Zixiibacteriota bacterium]